MKDNTQKPTAYAYLVDSSLPEAKRARIAFEMDLRRQVREGELVPITTGIVASVNHRLAQWQDYHENRSSSTPGKAYSAADRVADAIFQSRRPMLSISTPNPKIDLSVSPEAILRAYDKAQKGEKYIF